MAPKRKAPMRKSEEVDEVTGDTTTPSPPPLEGSPNVSELYALLQAAVAEDPAKLDEHANTLLQLLTEAENPEAPLLLRVRVLEFVARYGQHLRDGNALKKVVTSLVKILSGTEDTPQLLIAAVQGIASLGPVSMLDKKWEYLSREGADVLMQVMMDEAGFAENVRQAAAKSFDALVGTSFRPVVTKLLHWISDDREADDEEQLSKERRMALAKLKKMAFAPGMRGQWTEEVQEHVLGLIVRVLSTVTVREFTQLTRIAAALPTVQANNGIPLLTAFLARNKLGNERALESLGLIAQHVTNTPHDLVPALEEAGLMQTPIDTASAHGMWHARALLLAARLATTENADAVYTTILTQLARVMGDGTALPENLATLEALLFALVAAGQRRSVEFVQQLAEEKFSAACAGLEARAREVEPLVAYAVKKLVQQSSAGVQEADALACLHNLRVILGAFASRHIPMGALSESWTHKNQLPTLKRARDGPADGAGGKRGRDNLPLGALPPAPGTHDHAQKRTRTQSSNGNNRNNNNNNRRRNGNNNNNNGNNNNNRARGRRGGFY